MKKISNLTILTVPCNKMFVVSIERTTSFKNTQINEKLRKKIKNYAKN